MLANVVHGNVGSVIRKRKRYIVTVIANVPLKTALELSLARADALEPIPDMTDPLGRYWDQPKRSEIEVTDKDAIMTRATFDKLAKYRTLPTGVYPGKMWAYPGEVNYLFWYDREEISQGDRVCPIRRREITIRELTECK